MLAVAWQNVRRQPGRFAALAAAVALPILLVLVVSAVYLGLLDALIAYPRTLPGDVVVVEAGATPMFMRTGSRLPQEAVAAVRAVPGVAAVHEVYGRLVWVQAGGRGAFAYLVGLFPDDTVGGPVRVVAGRDRPGLGEIVLDRVLAHDLGLGLRQRLRVANARFRVAGIADGGNSVIGTFAFVNRNALGLSGVDTPSHLFVRAADGVDAATLAQRVGRVRGVRAYTRAEFLEDGLSLARRFYRPILAVIAVIAAGVGGTILALTLWGAALEQREDYGLLKAIGLSRRQLYAVAVWQALLATLLGAAVGLAGGYATAAAVGAAVPRFVTSTPWWLGGLIAAGAVLTGLVAALAPVRAVARIDPGVVFRV